MPVVYVVVGVGLTLITAGGVVALLPLTGLIDRLIAVAVLSLGLVIANALALSAFGSFFARPGVLALAGVEAALAGWRVARSPRAVASLSTDGSRARRGILALPATAARHRLIAILCGFLSVLYLWRTCAGVVIGVRDYDGLWYHLVTTMAFVHDHRIGVRIPVNLYSDSYAPNIEIVTAWGVLLSGTTILASVTQVPFAFLGALTTVAIGRRCGIGKAYSVGAGCLFLLTPIVIDQVSRQYNDVATAALAVTGMHLAAVVVTDRRLQPNQVVAYLALTGLTLGLAVGSKASTVVATAVLAMAVLIAVAVRIRRRAIPLAQAALGLLWASVALLVLGAPYYIRDLVLFGNPLEPFGFRLGPIHFGGPLDIQRDLVAPFRPPGIANLPAALIVLLVWSGHAGIPGQSATSLFGLQWFVLWPCLAVVTLWSLVKGRNGHFLLVVTACVASVALQPVAWWGRYTIYVVAPAAVAALWLLDNLGRRSKVSGLLAQLALALLAALAVWPLPTRFWPAPAGVPTSRFGVGADEYVTPAQAVRALLQHHRPVVERAPEYHWLLAAPQHSRILVTRRSPYFIGPLYGRDGSNAVVLVAADTAPDRLARVMADRDLTYAWLWGRGSLAAYASAHPAVFELVGQGSGARAFRLR